MIGRGLLRKQLDCSNLRIWWIAATAANLMKSHLKFSLYFSTLLIVGCLNLSIPFKWASLKPPCSHRLCKHDIVYANMALALMDAES